MDATTIRRRAWRAAGFCGICGKNQSKTYRCSDCIPAHIAGQRRRHRTKVASAAVNPTTERYRQYRVEAINRYGGKCALCGESHPSFLTLDHINNDGKSHRKTYRRIEVWLKANAYPTGIVQVLCWNCNHKKQIEHFRLTRKGDHTAGIKYRLRVKAECLAAYSVDRLVSCTCCSETDLDLLSLDHVSADGGIKRRTGEPTGHKLYLMLVRARYPSGYRTLCMNCNCGRALNGGTCPHEEVGS